MYKKTHMSKCVSMAIPMFLFGLILTLELRAEEAEKGEWLFWGHDIHNTKNPDSEFAINKNNVKNLKPEWIWEARSNVYVYPTIKDRWLYVTDYPLLSLQSAIDPREDGGWLYGIDRTTGETIWEQSIYHYSQSRANIVSRSSPAIYENLIVIGDAINAGTVAHAVSSDSRASVYGINRLTGELIWKTVVEDHFAAQVTQSPVVHEGVVYVGVSSLELVIPGFLGPLYDCCTFRGSMLALDARTGEILWKTYTIPNNYGQTDLFSGGSVWGSSPVIDEKRGVLYIATGNNYDVPPALKACLRKVDDDPWEEEKCYEKFDSEDNYFDSVLALDLNTGEIKWAQKVMRYDAWTFACLSFLPLIPEPQNLACPNPSGGDYDFGQAPMLIEDILIDGTQKDLVVVGQKTGIFWAFDPDREGELVWATKVGPYGLLGGHEFGSATDGKRIYAQITNFEHKEFPLLAGPYSGQTTNGGLWAGLDAATGELLWQMPVPGSDQPLRGGGIDHHRFGRNLANGFFAVAMGPISVANGIVYAGSMDKYMYALDGETGEILWSYEVDGSVNSAPSIVDGSLYWGSGYWLGFPGHRLYKFSLRNPVAPD